MDLAVQRRNTYIGLARGRREMKVIWSVIRQLQQRVADARIDISAVNQGPRCSGVEAGAKDRHQAAL